MCWPADAVLTVWPRPGRRRRRRLFGPRSQRGADQDCLSFCGARGAVDNRDLALVLLPQGFEAQAQVRHAHRRARKASRMRAKPPLDRQLPAFLGVQDRRDSPCNTNATQKPRTARRLNTIKVDKAEAKQRSAREDRQAARRTDRADKTAAIRAKYGLDNDADNDRDDDQLMRNW